MMGQFLRIKLVTLEPGQQHFKIMLYQCHFSSNPSPLAAHIPATNTSRKVQGVGPFLGQSIEITGKKTVEHYHATQSEYSVPGSIRHSSLHQQHLQDIKIAVCQSGLVKCRAKGLQSKIQYCML